MTEDEFMDLSDDVMISELRHSYLNALKEEADRLGDGWEAHAWMVSAASALQLADPAINPRKFLRSRAGDSVQLWLTAGWNVGLLRFAPKGFCWGGRDFDVDRYEMEALDFYFLPCPEGWKEAWSWVRAVTYESGGVELMSYADPLDRIGLPGRT